MEKSRERDRRAYIRTGSGSDRQKIQLKSVDCNSISGQELADNGLRIGPVATAPGSDTWVNCGRGPGDPVTCE